MPRRRSSPGTIPSTGQHGPDPQDPSRPPAGHPAIVRFTVTHHSAAPPRTPTGTGNTSVADLRTQGWVFDILDADGQVLDLPQEEADAFIEQARERASRKCWSIVIAQKIREMEQDPTTQPEDLRTAREALALFEGGYEAWQATVEAHRRQSLPPASPPPPTVEDRRRHTRFLQRQTTDTARRRRRPPPHPAEVLRDKYITPRGWSIEQAAAAFDFHPRPLQELLDDRGTLLVHFAKYFAPIVGTTEAYWHSLQQEYDAWHAAQAAVAPIEARPRRQRREPAHPGHVLQRQYLAPRGLAEAQVAAQLGISLLQIQSLLEARSPVTAPLALKLARVFQTTPQVWLNLQQAYDLYHARARDGDI